MSVEIDIRPVGANNVADLAGLFGIDRSTRHCWCTAFCTNSRQFAAGWFGGGNRRRFAEIAAASRYPMGVLALMDNEPAGWCGCGPRSRYTAAINGRSRLLRTRPRDEDDLVWLIACLFVAAEHRGRGITHADHRSRRLGTPRRRSCCRRVADHLVDSEPVCFPGS